MLSLKKTWHHFPGNTSSAFSSGPPLLFSIMNSNRHLTIPRHLQFLITCQMPEIHRLTGAYNATQKRKLTEVSDTEPSLFPLYRVRRKLAAFLTSFYKSNTVLKLTSTMLYPILATSLAEKGCSTAGSCWTKTIYSLERLTTSGT